MGKRHRYLGLGLVIVLVSFAAAGCGGGGNSPGVANLGATAATGTTTDPSSGGAPPGSAPSSGPGGQMMISGGNSLKFSQCMRAHGVANFPDPNSQGAIDIGPNSGIDPRSSTFQAAAQACQKLAGGGHGPQLTPAQQAKLRRQALAYSVCMRRHGVPDFPDPNFSGGHVSVHIQANGNSDLNPNSPTFQAAQQACQGKLPFKGAHTTSSGGAK